MKKPDLTYEIHNFKCDIWFEEMIQFDHVCNSNFKLKIKKDKFYWYDKYEKNYKAFHREENEIILTAYKDWFVNKQVKELLRSENE